MKLLVATKETQGKRKTDFCHATEGELVAPHFDCDGEKIDGPCGCRRSVSGIVSRKATTTFKVADLNLTERKAFLRFRRGLVDGGWDKFWTSAELAQIALADFKMMQVIAEAHPVGTVLERRGDRYNVR